MNPNKKVAVIFTGGTISMTVNQDTKAATPSLSSVYIISLVKHIQDFAEVELIDFSVIFCWYMDPAKMMDLK